MHDSWADILVRSFREVALRLGSYAPRVLAVLTLVLAGWLIAAVLRTQLRALQPDVTVVDPSEHGARLRVIRALRLRVDDVRAKFKYGGNVDRDHRATVLAHLGERDGPGDRAAAAHLERRIDR